MKIVVAPDSFKGSLSAKSICEITQTAVLEMFPECEVVKVPMADGGEGTVESVLNSFNGKTVSVKVKNPLGKSIIAKYGIFQKNMAIIEMAEASGLTLIKDSERDIRNSNTFGTGELILDAIKKGCQTIYIGIGGSATNDGGIGCAEALGVRFLDENEKTLSAVPANLHLIADIDTSEVFARVKETKFIIMSDVKNPLTGEYGCSNIFGRQKGANSEDIKFLDSGLINYAQIIKEKLGMDISEVEGAGAAGGLGAGLLAFTNASIRSGVETILDILNFDEKIENADLIITGEGKMDNQSAFGKVAFGVGMRAKSKGIPCVAIVGGLGDDYEDMFNHGIDSMMTTVNRPMSLEEAIRNADVLCYSAVKRTLRLINLHK